MRFLFVGLILLAYSVVLSSCATVQKEKIALIDEIPKVSKVLSQQSSQRFLKRKVAIARFTNETKYGQSFFVDENNDRIGKQAMDILSARLAATDRFILLERADIDKINKELNIGSLSNLNLSADYLIVGSVSEFGRKSVSDVGVFSRTKKQVAYASVNVRLIDVQTGRIIYSEEGDGEAFAEAGTVMGIGGKAGYDSSLNDQAISAAISKMVNNIVENLLDKPWRSYILSNENGQFVISGGKHQGIREQDIFSVYKRGQRVKNPQSNMLIELPGKKVGQIEVVATMGSDPESEVSVCVAKDCSLAIADFDNYYIEGEPLP